MPAPRRAGLGSSVRLASALDSRPVKGAPGTLLLAALLGAPAASARPAEPAPPKAATLPLPSKSWTGDLDGMLQRRKIRVLVPYSKTLYYVVNGAPRGMAFEVMKEFEKFVNAKFPPKTKHLKTQVLFVPVARDQLLPRLIDGRGDVAVADLTITEERKKLVDFTDPVVSGVDQIVVTGPQSPPVSSADDLSGQEVFVRRSSSFWGTLERLNERFRAEGREPITLRAAPEDLEDEDLLEMLNAGLFEIGVMDAYLPKLWKAIYPKIVPHPEIVLAPDGDFGWAIRRGSPKLLGALNVFVAKHRQGTVFGNTLIRKYTASPRMIRSATSGEDRKRFDLTVEIFRKYSARYGLDHLLVMAQGYQESRLDQNARSPVGAIGIMQVMPETGKDMKTGDIRQVEPNIHAGVKYVRFMVDEFYAGEPMDDLNKVLFAFASYNAGPGRIAQLRRLAAKRGLDPDVWTNNVEAIAAERIGMETVTYVANIYRYSVAYHLLAEREVERTKARETVRTGGPR